MMSTKDSTLINLMGHPVSCFLEKSATRAQFDITVAAPSFVRHCIAKRLSLHKEGEGGTTRYSNHGRGGTEGDQELPK